MAEQDVGEQDHERRVVEVAPGDPEVELAATAEATGNSELAAVLNRS
jgi:hypothetical protein